jgi:hypothetical protein
MIQYRSVPNDTGKAGSMTTECDEVEGLGVLRNRMGENSTGARPTRGEGVALTGILQPDPVNTH